MIRYGFDDGRFALCSHDSGGGLSDFVSCLAVEGDNLWIGTHGCGLCRYDIAADTLSREFDMLPYGTAPCSRSCRTAANCGSRPTAGC